MTSSLVRLTADFMIEKPQVAQAIFKALPYYIYKVNIWDYTIVCRSISDLHCKIKETPFNS